MSSSKQRRERIKLTQAERKAELERVELQVGLKKGTIIAVDREIEAIAIRCRACRRKEKLRRDTARKIHLEGVARKRNAPPN